MKRHHKAWAIDNGGKAVFQTSRVLLGKYCWLDGKPPSIPWNMDGYKSSVFASRGEARNALRGVKIAHPKARVVRVQVTVEVI